MVIGAARSCSLMLQLVVAAMARLLAAAPGTRRVAAVMWSSLALADTATALCLVTAHTAPDTVRCVSDL